MAAGAVPLAYQSSSSSPEWLNKGDNAWQMTSATLVGLQSMPGLVILYGSIVKKKWAINSAFMALYAFAAVWICWVVWAYNMSFGDRLLPFWGKARPALGQSFLVAQSQLTATAVLYRDGSTEAEMLHPLYPAATMVYFQCMFASITVIILAGSLLARMNIKAWMAFVPLWITFSYTVCAFSLWGGGFLFQWGVIDYSGGYVIHLSSGIAGLTAAYWVGPRSASDRERFPPNNILLVLAGAGLLWLGWTGFNGGDPYSANIDSSMAVLNTHICASTSLLMWTLLDVFFFGKPSVIGAVQGMITGLVCITPGAGLVQGWAAIVMGILSGSIPWYTMMVLHKKWSFMQRIDDTLGVFHTHAVAGFLGGATTGLFAEPVLCKLFLSIPDSRGAFYGGDGGSQFGKQIAGALFVIAWNIVITSIICVLIGLVLPLRISDAQLLIGDDAVHGEEAYAIWAEAELNDVTRHDESRHSGVAVGVTQNV
ncbi:ammonium transporter 3 member 3-like [Miscanthus floridulus]|uniref:ammonium transporter 3 member 3-like n=1 Tax=Miscanthus floridulus TaxID=154761 RepID=UPI003459E797